MSTLRLPLAACLFGLMCMFLPRPAAAQAVAPGARVRIVDQHGRAVLTGAMIRRAGDTVTVATSSAVTHHAARVEAFRGRLLDGSVRRDSSPFESRAQAEAYALQIVQSNLEAGQSSTSWEVREVPTSPTTLGRPLETVVVLGPQQRLEVSGGRHAHTLRGMGFGAAIGAALGIAMMSGSSKACDGRPCMVDLSGAAALGTTVSGMLIGAITGSRRTEDWRRADPVPRMAITLEPGHGVRLGASVAF